MKAPTLTDYINKKLNIDVRFAENYAREQIINSISELTADKNTDLKERIDELVEQIKPMIEGFAE